MALYFKEEDKQLLMSEVSIFDVINYLGIATKKTGSSISILCPNPSHTDHHFGSCIIRSNGKGYCYACNTPINAIKLLMWEGGLTYYEAMCTLARLSGRESDFEVSSKVIPQRKPFLKLTNHEKDLLGLATFSKAKIVTGVSYNKPEPSQSFRDDSGDYVLYDSLDHNPWTRIAKEDPETFKEVVQGKCLEKLLRIVSASYNLSNSFIQRILKDCRIESQGINEVYGGMYEEILSIYERFGGDKSIADETIRQIAPRQVNIVA